jgi:predicted aldo/keto reductase-like oxidoreductase
MMMRRICSNEQKLNDQEIAVINAAMEENRKLADLYCTGCNYCMPCPAEVNIPECFKLMNYHRVYNLTGFSRESYAQIGETPWVKGKRADSCIECGQCETKCPQKIKIIDQLKETHMALGV